MYMRVLRVAGRPGRTDVMGLSEGGRLWALAALAVWIGAAAMIALDLPMSLLGHLSAPVLAAVMSQVLPGCLLAGALLSAIAYVALLGETDNMGPVARHSAALSGIAALVCRAVAVPAVVDAGTVSPFAPAHAAAMALFALSGASAVVGAVGVALSRAPRLAVRRR